MQSQNETIRIGTFNAGRGEHLPVICEEVTAMVERVERFPDILLLQEITTELIEALSKILGDGFGVHLATSSTSLRGKPDIIGTMVRRDVAEVEQEEIVTLPRLREVHWFERFKGARTEPWQCIVQAMSMKVGDVAARFVNAHLEAYGGEEFRARQLAVGLDALNNTGNGTTNRVLGGDLNTSHVSPAAKYREMGALLEESGLKPLEDQVNTSRIGTEYPSTYERTAWVQRWLARHGITLPQNRDHILGDRDITAVDSGTFIERGSDHVGVWADVQFA